MHSVLGDKTTPIAGDCGFYLFFSVKALVDCLADFSRIFSFAASFVTNFKFSD